MAHGDRVAARDLGSVDSVFLLLDPARVDLLRSETARCAVPVDGHDVRRLHPRLWHDAFHECRDCVETRVPARWGGESGYGVAVVGHGGGPVGADAGRDESPQPYAVAGGERRAAA